MEQHVIIILIYSRGQHLESIQISYTSDLYYIKYFDDRK
jgi:hypothetical protein